MLSLTHRLPAWRQPARVLLVGLLAGLLGALSLPSAQADDYPLPTHERGGLNKTIFRVGELVIFTGSGYLPPSGNASSSRTLRAPAARAAFGTSALRTAAAPMAPSSPEVVISDNDKPLGTAQIKQDGDFRFSFRYGTDATLGQHTLVARGIGDNSAARDTTAVLQLVGVSSGHGGGPANGGGGGGGNGNGNGNGSGHGHLPFTGSDLRNLALVGLLLVLVGTLLVHRNLTARRERRAARRQARALAT